MSQLHDRITAALTANNITPTPDLVNDLAKAAKPPQRPVTDLQRATDALLSVTGWGAPMYARAARLVKALAVGEDYATVAGFLKTHYGPRVETNQWHWYRNDWRGLKNQRPDESGIRQTWGAWLKEPVREPSRFDGLLQYLQESE